MCRDLITLTMQYDSNMSHLFDSAYFKFYDWSVSIVSFILWLKKSQMILYCLLYDGKTRQNHVIRCVTKNQCRRSGSQKYYHPNFMICSGELKNRSFDSFICYSDFTVPQLPICQRQTKSNHPFECNKTMIYTYSFSIKV